MPSCLFLRSKGRRLLRKVPLPYAVCQQLIALRADIQVNGVVCLALANAVDEGQSAHFFTISQPPVVCLVAGQAGAVDAALLPGANADGLAVLGIAHTVGLGIF